MAGETVGDNVLSSRQVMAPAGAAPGGRAALKVALGLGGISLLTGPSESEISGEASATEDLKRKVLTT